MLSRSMKQLFQYLQFTAKILLHLLLKSFDFMGCVLLDSRRQLRIAGKRRILHFVENVFNLPESLCQLMNSPLVVLPTLNILAVQSVLLALESISVLESKEPNVQVFNLLLFVMKSGLFALQLLLVKLSELQALLDLSYDCRMLVEQALLILELLVLFFLCQHEGTELFKLSFEVVGVLLFLELAELGVLHKR